jgi:TatD DNase family protein
MKYFDIHSHMNFAAYDADREEVIKRSQTAGIGMITVGTQIDTSKAAVKLAQTHAGMYAAIGLHPIHTSASHHDSAELGEGAKDFTSRGEVANIEDYRTLANDPKTVAIGESGLDYFRLEPESVAKQVKAFETMIDLANEVRKPLMLHIRNGSGKSAYKDAFEILKTRSTVNGNLHFFAGSPEEAKPFLDLGYTFSFTGVITFARNYDEVINYIPLSRIMTETDCPYVTPAPYRGKRNEPSYVIEVIKALANIRKEDEAVVIKQVAENVSRVFGIETHES